MKHLLIIIIIALNILFLDAAFSQVNVTTIVPAGKGSLSPSVLYVPGTPSHLIVATKTRAVVGDIDRIGFFVSTDDGITWSGDRHTFEGHAPVVAYDKNSGYLYLAGGMGSYENADAYISVRDYIVDRPNLVRC